MRAGEIKRRRNRGPLAFNAEVAWRHISERLKSEDRGFTSPCWIWTLSLSSRGYARARVRTMGRAVRAIHRAAYELLVGPIPDGLTIDHLCRVPACCNPAHLEPVTLAENSRRACRDSDICGFKKQDVCRRGLHPLTEGNIHIDSRGARQCLACYRAYNRAWNRAKRERLLTAAA